jgi:hypothetical protein
MNNINEMNEEERAAWLALPMQERIRRIHADLDALIEKHGHTHMNVFPGKGKKGSGFTYSIGLGKLQLPEFIMTGNLAAQNKQMIICTLADEMRKNGGVKMGLRTDLFNVPIFIRDVTWQYTRVKYVMGAKRRYGPVRVYQILWADDKGKLPFERGWNKSGKVFQDVLPRIRTDYQLARILRHGSRREKVLAKRVLIQEQVRI